MSPCIYTKKITEGMLPMDYKKIHDCLIVDCLTFSPIQRIERRNPTDWRLTSGKVIYCEKHHIIPRHSGGSDDASNLLLVLPEEHLMLHALRYKVYKNTSDIRAVNLMANVHNNRNQQSVLKRYAWYRQKYSETCFGVNHPMYGKHHTEDTRKILSMFRRGKFYAKDVNTGEYIGIINKSHPNAINGKWVHVSHGIKNANKGRDQTNHNNNRWTGYSDEQILEHACLFYQSNGSWNRNDWFKYCDATQPSLPKHYNQAARFSEYPGSGTIKFQTALKLYAKQKHDIDIIFDKSKTEEHKHKLSIATSKKRWIYNNITKENKKIHIDDVERYVSNGWSRGRVVC